MNTRIIYFILSFVIPAPPPPDEIDRLRELQRLHLLDTPHEAMFDELTRLAADICDVPMASISLVDENRQWFKSRIGIDVDQTAREVSFCSHTILGNELLIVKDALNDARFHDNPLVTGSPNIRFYAGMPLTTRNQHNLGSFCVLDHKPRELTPHQRFALEVLGRQAARIAELHHLVRLQEKHSMFQGIVLTHAASGIIATNPNGIITHINPAAERMLQYSAAEVVGLKTPMLFHDEREVAARARELSEELGQQVPPGFDVFIAKVRSGGEETRSWTYRRRDGTTFPVLLSVSPLLSEENALIGYLGLARDISDQKQVENELRRSRAELTTLLDKISQQRSILMDLRLVQGEFINKPDARDAFEHLLALVLQYTGSEYGFIGEVLRDPQGSPYLKTLALTNISWDEATRKFYDEHAPTGLEFRNLKTLFGHVMTSGQVVIANDAPNDLRRGGLPPGHPPLNAFLGIPIHLGDDLVGMMGVANRDGGYSAEVLADIEPLIASYGNLIQARRNRVMREEVEHHLRENEARLQRVIEASGLGYWEQNFVTGNSVFSGSWETMLGYEPMELPRTNETWLRLLHPDDRDRALKTFQDHLEGQTSFYASEFRMKTRSGDWRWIASEGRVIKRDAAGKPEVVTGIHKDIHYRKVVEEQARQIKESQTLIQEVHHRVKNNLQIVSGLLSFQELQLADHPDIAARLQMTKGRVAAIASLHELLYRSSYPDKISIGPLMKEIVSQSMMVLGSESRRIKHQINADDSCLNYNQAGPFALILNELITNAVKYAFPGTSGGEVLLEAGRDLATGDIVMRCEDDGVGMSKEPVTKPGSIGLSLVRRLADQLQGNIELVPTARGTCWRLQFPVKE